MGKTIINPIEKGLVTSNQDSKLAYYYEPNPNSVEAVNEWGPYKGKYTINKDSLNERFEYAIDKPKNTFRIITLGDSYTYGLYVDTKDNWTEQLEDILNSKIQCRAIETIEVINLGVHGYDIQYANERFELRGKKYNPDLVLWLIKSDDLIQLNEVMYEKLASYAPSDGYSNWNRAMTETTQEIGETNIIQLQQKYIQS
ncbi:MAG TPA: SGNH/GDSL hydrolase family protein, partial [Candidatus Woesebacteria bacterium]|nr:SGNH/GDSL hydrolase family protein [Candidatus Woesebacteria bacterium]